MILHIYAFLIVSNLWSMANSLNISTFPYYGMMALFFMSDTGIHHVLLIGYDITKVVSYIQEHHIWIPFFSEPNLGAGALCPEASSMAVVWK